MAHATPLEEPKTPFWFTALGIGLFLLAGLVLVLRAPDESAETEGTASAKVEAPKAEAPKAEAPKADKPAARPIGTTVGDIGKLRELAERARAAGAAASAAGARPAPNN